MRAYCGRGRLAGYMWRFRNALGLAAGAPPRPVPKGPERQGDERPPGKEQLNRCIGPERSQRSGYPDCPIDTR
jgi:hypothetical protein